MTDKKNQPKQQASKPAAPVIELPRCEYCGEPFMPNHKKQRYCTESHKQMAYHNRKRQNSRE